LPFCQGTPEGEISKAIMFVEKKVCCVYRFFVVWQTHFVDENFLLRESVGRREQGGQVRGSVK
jgi:hypothetical protein